MNNHNHNYEYLICKVRYGPGEEQKSIENKIILDGIVKSREINGTKVHYPLRDVEQNDNADGMRICTEHRAAMRKANKVIIWYDATSTGSVFDTGMGFMGGKPLEILNVRSLENTANNEFEQFMMDYASHGASCFFDKKRADKYKEISSKRDFIRKAETPLKFVWKSNDWETLFNLGMIFMAEKPLILLNRQEVEAKSPNSKSYMNFVLAYDAMYK